MNKIKFLSCTAALLATLVGCNTEDTLGSASSSNKQTTSITAVTPNSGATTRTAYEQDDTDLKVTWSASNEKMYYLAATEDSWTAGQLIQDVTDTPAPTADEASSSSSSSAGTQANFTAYDVDGSGTTPIKKAGSIFALYPQKSDYATAFKNLQENGTSASVTLPLSNQTGKLEDLHNFDYMTAASDVKANDGNIEVSPLNMNHEIAVLHIAQGSEVSLESGSVAKIELSATSGFYGSGTMTITRNGSTISSNVIGTAGTITINGNFAVADNKLSDDVYVAILPTASFSGLKAKFTYSNGDAYTYNYSGKTTKFEKGKVYSWSPEIAAADKEFTLSGISQTGKRRTTIADKDINKWYCKYELVNSSYYKYTIDKLYIDTSTAENKATFTLKIGSSALAKNMTFKLISSKGVYRLWNKDVVDLDIKSFKVNWYANSSFTGNSTSVPDASHLYGKCEVVLKDLKSDGSDFYKQLVKSCTFTILSNYDKEQTISINALNRSLRYTYYGAESDYIKTVLKYQLPDNSWKEITLKEYEKLRDE